MPNKSHKICVLPGDGIGPEVVGCARQVLESLCGKIDGLALAFEEHSAGWDAFERTGESFEPSVLEAAKAADAVMVGAFDVAQLPPHAVQPLHKLRHEFDVHASVRPSRSYAGLDSSYGPIDVVVVREVTEGIYSGIEYYSGADAACSVM